MNKPVAESCLENQGVILEKITPLLRQCQSVLEIGSGTGQHAVYFAKHLKHLHWYTSDLKESHNGINQWINEAKLENVLSPFTLDVSNPIWPEQKFDAVFTANTLHIMGMNNVVDMFSHLPQVLKNNSRLIIYGPFNYSYKFTSESNQRFDAWLKSKNIYSGIRHFEEINDLAVQSSLKLLEDIEMPVNNRLLVFQYSTSR
ncbi:MAG: DUF938 domain-containing protein [Gammaproteobacteria bacterium]|nr:DUF938 domain-containing protein [Gammaproteobacteria bacterium]